MSYSDRIPYLFKLEEIENFRKERRKSYIFIRIIFNFFIRNLQQINFKNVYLMALLYGQVNRNRMEHLLLYNFLQIIIALILN